MSPYAETFCSKCVACTKVYELHQKRIITASNAVYKLKVVVVLVVLVVVVVILLGTHSKNSLPKSGV